MPLSRSIVRGLAALLFIIPLPGGAVRAESVAAVEVLREAARLADQGLWEAARDQAQKGGDLVADLIEWRHLRESEGTAEFAEYATFIAAHPDWPGLDRLRANGETAIREAAPPEAVIAYFGQALPRTGQGAIALARALTATGRGADAEAMLREVWLRQPLKEAELAEMLAVHGDLLRPLAAARAEAMLWRGRAADAEPMLSLLPDERRALLRARIALIRGQEPDLSAIPAALRDDPGLAHDRFARLAAEGRYSEALAILQARTGSAAALGEPDRWAAWRAQIARWLMREGRHQEAYAIAAAHHLTEPSESHADLEWLAGYLALRFLDEPAGALEHFRRSEALVRGPISLARAAYWQGRAEEALGRPDEAAIAYARGARHQTAFYGLLSAEKLGLPLDPILTGQEDFGDWRTSGRLAGDLPRAMLLLLAAGERADARLFALALARSLDREGVGQLAALLEEMHESHLAVLVGKAAVEQGIVVPAAYFPLHPMARGDWPVDTALALSIARRESEFDAAARSPVGAQGLMQLMPATAREVAGWLGLPYSAARLNEWDYNVRLGTRYLHHLEEQFGTSPVLIAAGYNAGPGRPRQWLAERGDFRDGSVDVVDWIEHIPFTETRIYVMRVAESIPVYRARLTGETGPVQFTALLRGAPPLIRPVARPDPAAAAATGAVERLSTASVPEAVAQAVAAGPEVGSQAEAPARQVAPQTVDPLLRPLNRPDPD